MWNCKLDRTPCPMAADTGRELTSAWKSLSQTKAALQHIENRLAAAPSTAVVLDPVMEPKKVAGRVTRKVSRKDGRTVGTASSGQVPKSGTRSHHSPEKGCRSPLRATTLDSNGRRPGCVEFREPLASYREPTPCQLEAQTLLSNLPGPSVGESQLSQMVYLRDTRDLQTRRSESPPLSAHDSTVVRYLNDRSALNALLCPDRAEAGLVEAIQSSNPGSASRRLDSLRRKQPNDKLEKLKERIRRQREHLEEAAEVEGRLGQPSTAVVPVPSAVPSAKVRKVTAAPPAPVYKGFNSSKTKIHTPDGTVCREEVRRLGVIAGRDVSLRPPEDAESKRRGTGTEVRPSSRAARKIHRSAPVDSKPAPVFNVASWREGQKLVKMILGPAPRVPREPEPETVDSTTRKGPPPRAKSDPRPESNQRQWASSVECNRGHASGDSGETGPEERAERVPVDDLPSADIQGLLGDLQPERGEQGCGAAKPRARSAPGTSTRRSRSESPTRAETAPKRRHYDPVTVRHYIARQQEERRKRQQDQRRAQRDEAERRSRRLQELYQKQREGLLRPPRAPSQPSEVPPQTRLQQNYTKLLLEQARAEDLQPKPPYQPSGESDKENKRLERPQSASSSSDLSLSESRPLPLSSEDLGVVWMQQEGLRPPQKAGCSLPPTTGHLCSQLLGLEAGALKTWNQRRSQTDVLTRSKQSRIEALKATAVSLSSRIETEARKLAGAAHSSARDTARPELSRDCWADPVSLPVRDGAEPDYLAPMIQRLRGSGHDAHDGVLPGVGNLHNFLNVSQGLVDGSAPQPSPALSLLAPGEGSPAENHVGLHDSSDGSISEGPLLSEGSLSEGDGEPGAGTEDLGGRDFCAVKAGAFPALARFQREAQAYPAFSLPPVETDSGSPWEELARGSPHSVINIFIKQLRNHGRAFEAKAEPDSSPSCPVPSATGHGHEDDFISSPRSGGSSQSSKRTNSGLSTRSAQHEPLTRGSPRNIQPAGSWSHRFVGSMPVSSPCSAASGARRVSEESVLEQTLPERQNQSFDTSENQCQESSRVSKGRSSARGSGGDCVDSDGTPCNLSGRDMVSLSSNSTGSPRNSARSSSTSPVASTSQKVLPDAAASAGIDLRKAASPQPSAAPQASIPSSPMEPSAAAPLPGEPRHSPGSLQQCVSAELSYLETVEESMRQLADLERLRSVSLAQQESVSLAHILKAQQQRHEHELLLLKLRAEKEELDSRRQLEETRQRAARVHAELQENMAKSQQVSLEGLQDTARRMMGQQAEAVRHTADAARHIREMTELARSQIAGAMNVPPAPVRSPLTQKRLPCQAVTQPPQPRPTSERRLERSPDRSRTEDTLSSVHSPFESLASGTLGFSSSSAQVSPSLPLCDKRESVPPVTKAETSSSVEEEVDVAVDGVPFLPDEKDDTSIATEYSMKLDEMVTEDDVEECSFRSLLPSESQRRVTMEKRWSSREELVEDAGCEQSRELDNVKSRDGSMPFSGGQDSFSRFTMDMVRRYMTEEEVRAQHQSSLLRLREKALKEKTRAELAWLEHQKRRLRDKGEDDKMPPIRKRQRGLLLKLQQEQAEIKRLQEANEAARKERQLLLKQQEEIERMRSSTMRLKERLKSAGEADTDTAFSEVADEVPIPSLSVTDLDTRSPSPVSMSGSETSSIMQKLKKMRCHMDEKFLTKREQQLVRRRRHAEELLQWKRRLDAEEAEVRNIERRALAVWGREGPMDSPPASRVEGNTPREQGGSHSPAATASSQPTESSVHEEIDKPTADLISELSSTHKDLSHEGTSIYSESKLSPPSKAHSGPFRHGEGSGWGKCLPRSTTSRSDRASCSESHSASRSDRPSCSESRSAPQSEPTSDQSDLESRVRALKEELRRRKSIVYQLKKEQKRRDKERLKAQEASLLKQLECYDNFIQKTKAELRKDLDATPTAKPQIKARSSAIEKPRIKAPPIQRPETGKNWSIVNESEKEKGDDFTQSDSSGFKPVPKEESSDGGPPTSTPAVELENLEHLDSLRKHISSELLSGFPSGSVQVQSEDAKLLIVASGEEDSFVSSQKSEVEEELEHLKSDELGSGSFHSLKLDQDISSSSCQQQASLQGDVSVKCSEPELDVHISEEKNGGAIEKEDLTTDCLQSHRSGPAAKEPQLLSNRETPTVSECSLLDLNVLSPEKENLGTRAEVCSDSYHDDFESSVESSLQGGSLGSKLSSFADQEKSCYSKSPTFSNEEEISEEIQAELSSASECSHSERFLQLEDSKEKVAEVKNTSPQLSPSVSPPPSEIVDAMPDFNIGDRVLVSNVEPGTLRYKGTTSFAKGFWAGVELDKSEGSNNGSYDGVAYFECEEGHGIFAPPDKVSLLPEKFEICGGTTEDEDSSDDQLDSKSKKKHKAAGDQSKQSTSQDTKDSKSSSESGNSAPPDTSGGLVECWKNQAVLDIDPILQCGTFELSDLKLNTNKKLNGTQHLTPNGTSRSIILELEDASTGDFGLLITEVGKQDRAKASTPLLDLLTKEKVSLEAQQKPSLSDHFLEEEFSEKLDVEKRFDKQNVGAFTDKLLNNFVTDAIKQFQKIKKDKNEKILTANQLKGNEDGRCDLKEMSPKHVTACTAQLEDLPNFIEDGQEEASSPELCARPESPVLGTSGKEELAKRLAELELSRELLDEFGEEQDWFDEDFGLSSRKEQQKRQQRQEPVPSGPMGLEGMDQAKVPARSELPQQAKLQEEPAMVVPHNMPDVEQLVGAATQAIWISCDLGHGLKSLAGVTPPHGSEEYLGCSEQEQDMVNLSKRSYRQTVFDLTWEIMQEIFSENTDIQEHQWAKPRRLNSSYFRRVKSPSDIGEVQAFVTTEVLKLLGLMKEHNQKTDWQKMLKFGRKKRDRVDHILVQELHEEESQWVNYDKDELFVKMQLADGIFDTLMKDTVDVFIQIQEKQAKTSVSKT